MKSSLWLVSTFVLLTASAVSAQEWVSPSKAVCTQNGGKLSRGGVCYAKWDDAKRICMKSDASLPSLDALREVLAGCGGKFDDYTIHKDDPAFQACSKMNGFAVARHYWSSTGGQVDGYAMAVRFSNGYEYMSKKSKVSSVHCVKASK